MTLATKYSKYDLPQQLVEMLVLQKKPWIVRYKKKKELGLFCLGKVKKAFQIQFKVKKAFQNGKILACIKNLNLRHFYSSAD